MKDVIFQEVRYIAAIELFAKLGISHSKYTICKKIAAHKISIKFNVGRAVPPNSLLTILQPASGCRNIRLFHNNYCSFGNRNRYTDVLNISNRRLK